MPNDGQQVTVHYTGTLEDGTEFDSSRDRDPLTFELGSGQIIPGFEDAVRGLDVGESTQVRLEPEQAYGQPDPSLVVDVPAESAPDDLNVGDRVMLGNGVPATVIGMDDSTIKIDANHPLAGKTLIFDLELVAIA